METRHREIIFVANWVKFKRGHKMSDYFVKSAPCDIKANNSKRIIEGHASVFDFVDHDNDVILAGAFQKTIEERLGKGLIKLLWQHSDPLGMPIKMAEDGKGLHFEAKISKTRLGDDALELINDRVVDRMSIGYRASVYEFDEKTMVNGHPVRLIKEIDPLFEISPVTFAANEMATINNLKNLSLLSSRISPVVVENKSDTLPIADRELEWDSDEAIKRIRVWAGAEEAPNEKYASAFLWVDEKDKEHFGAYKLPVADIVDGELKAVPRGVFAAAASVQGARGGLDVPDSDLDEIKKLIAEYYNEMSSVFEDDDIIVPWQKSLEWIHSTVSLIADEAPRVLTDGQRKLLSDLSHRVGCILEASPVQTGEYVEELAAFASERLNEILRIGKQNV